MNDKQKIKLLASISEKLDKYKVYAEKDMAKVCKKEPVKIDKQWVIEADGVTVSNPDKKEAMRDYLTLTGWITEELKEKEKEKLKAELEKIKDKGK